MSAKDIERLKPAIFALQEYAHRSGDIKVGAPLSPIVRAILQALREPSEEICQALPDQVDPENLGLGITPELMRDVVRGYIDHLLAE